jgi:hypothetical protein
MALLIVADISSLGHAARSLGSAGGGAGPAVAPPSLGDAGADGALGDFASAIHQHASRLADASDRASRSMHGYAIGFHQAGG